MIDLAQPPIAIRNELNQFLEIDLSQKEQLSSFFDSQVGRGKFDYFIHCASIMHLKRFEDFTWEEIERVLNVNLVGTIQLLHLLIPHMNDNGRIVLFSSAVTFKNLENYSIYSATKAGLDSLVKSLARELGGRGITVNSIAPGFIATKLTDSVKDQEQELINQRSIKKPLLPRHLEPIITCILDEGSEMITGSMFCNRWRSSNEVRGE
ncbi:3-alpha-(or 20-beta)-hydroxysteroid dehydrogenase [Ureibacillus acetophenoni]